MRHLIVSLLVVAAAVAPTMVGAYRISFLGQKFQHYGLPSQGHSFQANVGHIATLGVSREQFIDMLEGGWGDWDAYMNSGLDMSFEDAGEVQFPWQKDGQSTIQFRNEGGAWAGLTRIYGSEDEPWRTQEYDIKLRECPEWCWLECPAICFGDRMEIDVATILRHELGHVVGLDHCWTCTSNASIMVPYYDPGCTVWTLESEDHRVAGDMYGAVPADDDEPGNDLWESPSDAGTLNADVEYDERWATTWLGSVLDVDIHAVQVSGSTNESRFAVAVIPPQDLDVAFAVHFGGEALMVVDDRNAGGAEFFDAPADAGTWMVRVFCPDLTSDTWDANPYDLQLTVYAPVAEVGDDSFSQSLWVTGNPSAEPRIHLHGAPDGTTVRIVDAVGRAVVTDKVSEHWEWSATGLSAGAYFAIVKDGSLISTRRFTVVR